VPTNLIIKNSTTGGSAPSAGDLETGELAVNLIDKKVYSKDNSNAIVELGTNPSTITLGGVVTITTGSTTPNGNTTGTIGSLYLRTASNSEGNLYVKTTGTGNTGWTALTN